MTLSMTVMILIFNYCWRRERNIVGNRLKISNWFDIFTSFSTSQK